VTVSLAFPVKKDGASTFDVFHPFLNLDRSNYG
jgi:hypothetical protein